jgi:diaminohydroxyphosphoribosylaminopyrimidine deaminase/5-amino-6-(5-phosphoribosylamino)uracil reductase
MDNFMKLACELALRGRGLTGTNPCVGAVIVKNGSVISSGWHKEYGGPHAEVEALRAIGGKAEGAEMYVTLEPCTTFGKTPPCSDAIIKSGIKKVFIGVSDPNPVNASKAETAFRNAGIVVVTDVNVELCRDIIKDFTKYMATGFPFVTLKIAQSLDGKIASRTGDSKWITAEASRHKVHKLRSYSNAVLVGINTVIKDDPELTNRLPEAIKQPMRVVLDSKLKIPLTSKLTNTDIASTTVFTASAADKYKTSTLKDMGVTIIHVKHTEDGLDLQEVLGGLGRLNVLNLLVEGGGEVFASFLNQRLADKLYMVTAPIIVGGRDAPSSIGGRGSELIENAVKLSNVKVSAVDCDYWFEADL